MSTVPMLAQRYKGWEPLLALSKVVAAALPVSGLNRGHIWQQPKLDGVRCIASRAGLFTRRGHRIKSCPHIEVAVGEFFAKHPEYSFLDGELYHHDFRDDFGQISGKVRRGEPAPELQYHVYDATLLDDPKAPWSKRAAWLEYLDDWHPVLQEVLYNTITNESALDWHYARMKDLGYEGQIIRLDGPYEFGKRSWYLQKRKEYLDAEFPVVALHEGKGAWAGTARAATVLVDGKECRANIVGDHAKCAGYWAEWQGPNASSGFAYATVKFMRYTKDGLLREPRVYKFHPKGDRV